MDQPVVGSSLRAHFVALPDPRIDRTKRHQLVAILTIAICAVRCGADSWVEVERFGRAKLPWLRTFLAVPNGIPSHDTFGRVFAALAPQRFEQCFLSWVPAIVRHTNGEGVALDGKTLRRSHDRSAGQAALQLVSAWAETNRLVLGQVAVDAKSNEITALPALLQVLALAGCIVTIDAMGCQRAIAQTIVDRGGDYVLALKEHQPTLHDAVADAVAATFATARTSAFRTVPHDDARTVNGGHGRVEIRQHWTLSAPAVLATLDWTPRAPGPGWPAWAWSSGSARSGPRPRARSTPP